MKHYPVVSAWILLIIVLVIIAGDYLQGYFTEKGKQAAQIPEITAPGTLQTQGDQSPTINTGAGSHIQINFDSNSHKEKVNNSEDMPFLVIKPIVFEPYAPSNPQAIGQFKAKIVIEVILKNNKIANNVRVKFDIDDGAGRRVDSEEWDAIANQKPLIFSMAFPDVKTISWTPDIPNGIKEIAQNREKPFILRLLVVWENINKRQYGLMSYSELRYNESSNKYYFDERENKYLFEQN